MGLLSMLPGVIMAGIGTITHNPALIQAGIGAMAGGKEGGLKGAVGGGVSGGFGGSDSILGQSLAGAGQGLSSGGNLSNMLGGGLLGGVGAGFQQGQNPQPSTLSQAAPNVPFSVNQTQGINPLQHAASRQFPGGGAFSTPTQSTMNIQQFSPINQDDIMSNLFKRQGFFQRGLF
jgi:hypothetical protein